MTPPPVPPIPGTPSGAGLLEGLHAALTRYVIFPSPQAADAGERSRRQPAGRAAGSRVGSAQV